MSTNLDFLILSALDAERKALESVLGNKIKGRMYQPGLGEVIAVSINSVGESRQTIEGMFISIPNVGRVDGALTAARALTTWLPRCLVLVGVAGGFAERKVELGDLLISTGILDCAIQKATGSSFIIRPRLYPTSESLLRTAKTIVFDNKYCFPFNDGLQESHVHFGPIASGDVVVASSKVVRGLLKIEPTLIGVDMEAAGVAAAVENRGHPIELIEIRGVADLADESKTDNWIERSCYAAAHFAVDLICRLSL